MTITARYANEDESVIIVAEGAVELNVPKDPDNTDYQTLVANGIPIAGYVPPPINADDVRAERDRRLWAAVGANNRTDFDGIVNNATMEAVRLLRKGEAAWTEAESARANELEHFEIQLAAIRTKSAELEVTLPENYQDDMLWKASTP